MSDASAINTRAILLPAKKRRSLSLPAKAALPGRLSPPPLIWVNGIDLSLASTHISLVPLRSSSLHEG
jgi:hypothetical protein